jgi:signal transduction histidine kinase
MLLHVISAFILTSILEGILFFWFFKRGQSNYSKEQKSFNTAKKINRLLLQSFSSTSVVQKLADFLPEELGFATGVIALYEKDRHTLRRVAASETKEAIEAIKALSIPFTKIEISMDDPNNLMSRALRQKKLFVTSNLYDVFVPVLTQEESAKIQQIMSIQSTIIYSIYIADKPLGVFIASSKKKVDEITDYDKEVIGLFVDGAGIALQNMLFTASLQETTESLKVANDRLRELDHLKDDFVSLAAHELRTPMTAIKSYLWMAIAGKGGPLNDKQMYYAQRSYNSVDRLIKLVNDMLNISRIESGRLTVQMGLVNMEELVREVIEEVTPRAKELGLDVVIGQREGVVSEVLADADKIKGVIYNLVGNSMKFTPSGGKITVSFVTKDKMVEVAVSDTGSGILDEDLPKLFQKFGILPGTYIDNQKVSGTGLGLYICRSLVELHGGKIWASSEGKGKGTTFTFSLKVFNQEDLNKFKEKYSQQGEEKVGLINTKIA